jgi:hypothetical protein
MTAIRVRVRRTDAHKVPRKQRFQAALGVYYGHVEVARYVTLHPFRTVVHLVQLLRFWTT